MPEQATLSYWENPGKKSIEGEFEIAGIRVEKPRFFEKVEIDFDFFDKNIGKQLQKDIDSLWIYLEKPFVFDNFTDNEERDAWRKKIQREFGKTDQEKVSLLVNSKLRSNIASEPLLLIGIIKGNLKGEKYKELVETLSSFEMQGSKICRQKDAYQSRKEQIEAFENLIYDFINTIAEFSNRINNKA